MQEEKIKLHDINGGYMATSKEDRLFKNMINYDNLSPAEQKAHDDEMFEYLTMEFKRVFIKEDASPTRH